MTIWILSGEDTFLRDNHRQQILSTWLKDIPEALQSLMHAVLVTPSVSTLTDQLLAQVFAMGGTPILEVRGFDGFRLAMASDPEREALQSALLQSTKHVLMVTPKLDKKLKWIKWLLSQSEIKHDSYDPLAFWETDKAIARLMQLAQQQQITLQPTAATHMVDALGTDFYSLAQVLNQAYTLASGQPVTKDHVAPFLPTGDNLFNALTDWITQKPGKGWPILDQALQIEAPQRVLALIQKMLHDYWLVKTLTDQGQPAQDIAGWVGKKPGWVSMQLRWLARVPAQRLTDLKQYALETENAIKAGHIEGRLGLELLWAR